MVPETSLAVMSAFHFDRQRQLWYLNLLILQGRFQLRSPNAGMVPETSSAIKTAFNFDRQMRVWFLKPLRPSRPLSTSIAKGSYGT
jgi:hypothetical protein